MLKAKKSNDIQLFNSLSIRLYPMVVPRCGQESESDSSDEDDSFHTDSSVEESEDLNGGSSASPKAYRGKNEIEKIENELMDKQSVDPLLRMRLINTMTHSDFNFTEAYIKEIEILSKMIRKDVEKYQNVQHYLEEDEILEITKKFLVENYGDGQYIYRIGHPAEKFYIVLQGSVSFQVKTEAKMEKDTAKKTFKNI